MQSAQDFEGESFPDANVSVSWQVPDGGIEIDLIFYSLCVMFYQYKS